MPPEALDPCILPHERDLVLGAAGQPEVVERHFVDREDAAGCAVFRRHVRDCRPVGERQLGEPVAEELDEFLDDSALPEHLGHGQDEVGRRRAFREAPRQFHADHFRDQHGGGLAEHGGFGLDSADAPAEHADAVDHRRVRVGPDDGIGIGEPLVVGKDDPRQVFEIHLVDDAGVGRDDREIVEGRLSPAQEGVALAVALEFEQGIEVQRIRRSVVVHHHRVVDHELCGDERVDLCGIAAELRHGVAHGGEVHDGRHAREVLHDDARRRECDLALRQLARIRIREGEDVGTGHAAAVLVPQQVLEQDLQRVGETPDRVPGERVECEVVVALAADGELAAGFEAVLHETSSGCIDIIAAPPRHSSPS